MNNKIHIINTKFFVIIWIACFLIFLLMFMVSSTIKIDIFIAYFIFSATFIMISSTYNRIMLSLYLNLKHNNNNFNKFIVKQPGFYHFPNYKLSKEDLEDVNIENACKEIKKMSMLLIIILSSLFFWVVILWNFWK